MSSIDERIVKMRFENSQFEQGVSKTNNLLNSLKKSFNFDKSVESINQVDRAVNKVDFNPLTASLQGVQSGFNAMGAVAFSVINRITNAAIDAGRSITNSLTASIRDGFAEYETQMGAIQTILSNTSSKGTNLDQVNRALDTLNTYADKTIYNFTEMTRNIGTFTAAGVDLQTSVDSIKGIANLAAASGSSSMQAAQAMYQLSQALAAGKIQLMDWNSVVNAGMGGELFQNALKRTAENFGTDVDAMIAKYGSFRESLTQGGWLTSQVLTETLKQISGAYTESELISQGYTEQQAKDIVALAKNAEDAATKVKTFTQLLDTTKEALGSGWTQSWELIIGDFEESKDLWTGISNQLNDIISASSNARNELLSSGLSSGWKQILDEGIADTAGFQEIMTQTARDHGIAIDNMIAKNGSFTKSMSEGWVTADIVSESVQRMADKMNGMSQEQRQAAGLTAENVDQINQLNDSLQNGSLSAEDFAEKMNRMSGRENVIAGLGNVFNDLGKIFERIGKVYREVFPAMTGDELYSLTERFKTFTETLTPSEKTLERIGRIAKGVFSTFDIGAQIIKAVGNAIARAFGSDGVGDLIGNLLEIAATFGDTLTGLDQSIKQFGIFEGVSKTLGNALSWTIDLITSFTGGLSSLASKVGSIASSIGNVLGNAFKKVGDIIGNVVSLITDNISGGDIFAGLAGGGIFLMARKLGDLFEKIQGVIDGIFGKKSDQLKKGAGVFGETLESLKDSLNAFTGSVKAITLVEIAGAIAILVNSIEKISGMKAGDVSGGIATIGLLMTELNLSLKSIGKTLAKYKPKDLIKTGVALIAFAKSVQMLSDAMKTIGTMDWKQIAKGLSGMGLAMAELVIAAKGLSRSKVSLKTSLSMLAMAESVKMVAESLQQLSKMSWKEIGRGLSAMGGALGEMATITGLLGRFGKHNISASLSVLITAKSLGDIAEAFGSFTQYNWPEIGRGLTAMGGALGEVGIVTGALGKIAGLSGILGAGSIFIVAKGLEDIAEAFGSFTQYNWSKIGRGLAAMGGALGEIGLVSGALGKIAGLSGILGAGSIFIVAKSLDDIAKAFGSFTQYNWSEIGRGLVAMGSALGEVALISGALGVLSGISGLLGAGTILLAVQGLNDLAEAFGKFTQYNWDEIGRGLVAMGGAMGEVAIISGATGALAGIAGLVGAGTITLASKGLIDLATAFGKFAEFDWDEIGRGLSAMGAAMGETALGSLLNTFSGFGAGAISKVAGPLGVLADSMKKWKDVSVPKNLSNQIGSLADGIIKFTLAGFGGSAIATIAEPMGTLATSLAKWSKLVFPANIGNQLKQLADGVSAFTLAFAGGWSMSAVVGPFGQLADAIKKWKDVVIPAGIKKGLTDLADGINAFSLSFVGGWSLDSIVGPFGRFAASVNKWKDVVIPSGIKRGLTNLADGINAFSLSFASGWSLDALAGPFGRFAGAVAKWNNVVIPGNLSSGLKGLASGANAFSNIGENVATNILSVSSALGKLAKSAISISTVNLPVIGSGVSSFIASLSGISNIGSDIPNKLSGVSQALTSSIGLLSTSLAINTSIITSSFNSLKTNISASVSGLGTIVSNNMVQASNAVSSGASWIMSGSISIVSAFVSLSSSVRTAIAQFSATVQSKLSETAAGVKSISSEFKKSGNNITKNLIDGLKSKINDIPNAFAPTMNSALSNLNDYHNRFKSTGEYVASGFVEGISSKVNEAANQAARMAKAASDAAKKQLDIHSPSKVFAWIGQMTVEGLTNSLDSSQSLVSKSASNLAEATVNGFDSIDTSFYSDFDPSIKPVMDLSMIRSQTGQLSSMIDSSIDPIKAKVDFINRYNGQNGGDSTTMLMSKMDTFADRFTKEITNLRDDFSSYQKAIESQETAMYVDGKKLASSIAKPMNQQMGRIIRRENLGHGVS